MNYKSCWITLNRACNLRCKWCYARSTSYLPESDMSLKTAYEIIDICSKLNIKNITLIGGEPTLYPNLTDVINYIHSKGIRCGFVTNGIKLSDNLYVKKLIECGVKQFSVSLKGEDEKTFEELTGSDSLGKVINGIKNCLCNGAKVSVSMVLTEDNVETYLRGIQLMKELGVNNFRLSFCYDFNTTGNLVEYLSTHNPKRLIKKFVDSYDELDKITNHRFKLSQSYPMCMWDDKFIQMLKRKKQVTSVCQLLTKSGLLFDTEGNIIPCNAMHELKLGKLHKDFENAEELLRYTQKDDFRMVYDKLCGVPDETCLECNKLQYCGGGCVCQWTNYSYKQLMDLEEDL